ncbi:MAG TPA: START-like domain-containing protein, partial [Saprospiraceae bacterium]|nr:START-like domain-containing protein [Saprospiraceae bacterium]
MSRVKIDLEFIFKASPAIVYQFLTEPTCLVRWFCEEADVNNELITFTWDGYDQEAEILEDIEEEKLKLRWLDADDEDEYL